MSATWVVRFCDKCFRAFDVRAGSRAYVCDECIQERKRENMRDWRDRHPRERKPRRLVGPEPWMLERHAQGCSYSQIAREAGMSKSTILRRFQRTY